MRLDYGSGRQPKKGFMSSDFCGAPNYDFYIEDYVVQDLGDDSCEVIHCRNVIHHIPKQDLPKLVDEFRRLLKPGGKLIISEPRKEFHEQNKLLDIIWYRHIVRDTSIMIPSEYVNYKMYFKPFFDVLSVRNEFNNEILILRDRTRVEPNRVEIREDELVCI